MATTELVQCDFFFSNYFWIPRKRRERQKEQKVTKDTQLTLIVASASWERR